MCEFISHVKSVLARTQGNKFTTSAISSFLSSVGHRSSDSVTESDLLVWIVDMIRSGFKQTTRKRYFGRLRTLYNEWTSDGVTSPFSKVSEAINFEYQGEWQTAENNLEKVLRLFKRTHGGVINQYINAFLYLLYDVGASMEDVVRLKFESPTPDLPQIDDIIDDMRETKQLRYVFGLNRGAKREGQIVRELKSSLNSVLAREGMRFPGEFTRDSVTAIWIAAAMRCNIPSRDIRSLVDSIPSEYSYLSLLKAEAVTDEKREDILRIIADSINDKTQQWFVMKLRRGYTAEEVKKAIEQRAPEEYSAMSFYYPMRTTYRKDKNGKRIREEKPFLPELMFFRTYRSRVGSLFQKIGEMAWCYRTTGAADSPYSTISAKEMMKFQRHVGLFTDDIRTELMEETCLSPGDLVKIDSGILQGNIGVITSVANQDGTRTYTLRLSTQTSFNWTVVEMANVSLSRC